VVSVDGTGNVTARGEQLLIFENETGRQVDFDLRGTLDDILERVKTREAPKGPGRPRPSDDWLTAPPGARTPK
jgi:hypothetical protein